MDQLFKALPRDLQWEILSVFVGTHVVRNGKLMRKMTGDIQTKLLDNMNNETEELLLKNNVIHIVPSLRLHYNNYMNVCIWFDSGHLIMICENLDTHEISYVYSREFARGEDDSCEDDIITVLNNDIILSPFIKHNYPSYPYTDKKMGKSSTKMLLYNPTRSIDCQKGLALSEYLY